MSADAGAAAVPVPVDAGTRPSSGRPELGAAGRGEGTNLTNSRVAVKGMASSCGTRCVRRSRSRARGKWGHVAYLDVRARRTSVGRADLSILPFLGSPCGAGCFGLVRASRPSSSRPAETGDPGQKRSGQLAQLPSCHSPLPACELRIYDLEVSSRVPSGERSKRAKRLIHHNKRRGGI